MYLGIVLAVLSPGFLWCGRGDDASICRPCTSTVFLTSFRLCPSVLPSPVVYLLTVASSGAYLLWTHGCGVQTGLSVMVTAPLSYTLTLHLTHVLMSRSIGTRQTRISGYRPEQSTPRGSHADPVTCNRVVYVCVCHA